MLLTIQQQPLIGPDKDSDVDQSMKQSINKAGYHFISQIGSGVSAKVFKCSAQSNAEIVAIKVIQKNKVPSHKQVYDGSAVVPMEVYILRRLRHPSIIQLLDFWSDSQYYYIVMEQHGHLWSGSSSDLFECIEANGPLQEVDALKILQQLTSVCRYLRAMNVWHLDIKDENVSCDANFRIKLLDFGSAMISDSTVKKGYEQLLTRFYGTLKYCPPEVFQGKNYSSHRADCWSLGIIFFTCLNGHAPFKSPQDTLAGKPTITRQGLSVHALALIRGLLQVDPNKRFTLEDIQQRLSAYRLSTALF